MSFQFTPGELAILSGLLGLVLGYHVATVLCGPDRIELDIRAVPVAA